MQVAASAVHGSSSTQALEHPSTPAQWEEILEDYPFLEREEMQACLNFAVAHMESRLLVCLSQTAILAAVPGPLDHLASQVGGNDHRIDLARRTRTILEYQTVAHLAGAGSH